MADTLIVPPSSNPEASAFNPPVDGWTTADSLAALAEGWDIFDCDGSSNGRFQLSMSDEHRVFRSDHLAWSHVVLAAQRGSDLHRRAIDFIGKNNPIERRTIEEHFPRLTIWHVVLAPVA